MSDESRCWICKRTFEEALKEFNEAVQSNQEVSGEIKARYAKGKNEFIPEVYDKFVGFRVATIKEGKYSVTGEITGHVHIRLCPVCSGLFESLLDGMDEIIKDRVSEELENVSISIKRD